MWIPLEHSCIYLFTLSLGSLPRYQPLPTTSTARLRVGHDPWRPREAPHFGCSEARPPRPGAAEPLPNDRPHWPRGWASRLLTGPFRWQKPTTKTKCCNMLFWVAFLVRRKNGPERGKWRKQQLLQCSFCGAEHMVPIIHILWKRRKPDFLDPNEKPPLGPFMSALNKADSPTLSTELGSWNFCKISPATRWSPLLAASRSSGARSVRADWKTTLRSTYPKSSHVFQSRMICSSNISCWQKLGTPVWARIWSFTWSNLRSSGKDICRIKSPVTAEKIWKLMVQWYRRSVPNWLWELESAEILKSTDLVANWFEKFDCQGTPARTSSIGDKPHSSHVKQVDLSCLCSSSFPFSSSLYVYVFGRGFCLCKSKLFGSSTKGHFEMHCLASAPASLLELCVVHLSRSEKPASCFPDFAVLQ